MSAILPEHVLRKMSPADRKALDGGVGRAGMLAAEAAQAAATRAEKQIQADITGLLRLHDVPHICPPMNRRSQLPEGWPDITFAWRGVPVCWEIKVPGQKPRPEQRACAERLMAAGWRYACLTSAAEAKNILRELDHEHNTQQH